MVQWGLAVKSLLLAAASSVITMAGASALSIPLAGGWLEGGPRLLVDVAPAAAESGWLPGQRLLLDTGSSTLAFCQNSLLQEASYEMTGYVSCNEYNPGGNFTGYWGPFVNGSIRAGNWSLPNSFYSVMTEQVAMPCTNGFQGIFGIAFVGLDAAISADEFSHSNSTQCPDSAATLLPPPLIHQLQAMKDVEMVGLYWSGKLGEDEGMLYIDGEALNDHYEPETAVGPAVLGEFGWYDIIVPRISVGDVNFTNFSCTGNSTGQCSMDTGTPTLSLPAAVINQTIGVMERGDDANLTVWLLGPSGEEVPISFDVAALGNMSALSENPTDDDSITLGLPLWAFYYTIFNITGNTVSFFPQRMTSAASAPEAEEYAAEPWGHQGRRTAELPVHV